MTTAFRSNDNILRLRPDAIVVREIRRSNETKQILMTGAASSVGAPESRCSCSGGMDQKSTQIDPGQARGPDKAVESEETRLGAGFRYYGRLTKHFRGLGNDYKSGKH
jgi:hypothetical protein